MFTIDYTTHCNVHKSISVMDEDYAFHIFKALTKAIDCSTIDMIDGFTGEVLMEWCDGEYTVINSHVVR